MAIEKLNPDISSEAIEQAIEQLTVLQKQD